MPRTASRRRRQEEEWRTRDVFNGMTNLNLSRLLAIYLLACLPAARFWVALGSLQRAAAARLRALVGALAQALGSAQDASQPAELAPLAPPAARLWKRRRQRLRQPAWIHPAREQQAARWLPTGSLAAAAGLQGYLKRASECARTRIAFAANCNTSGGGSNGGGSSRLAEQVNEIACERAKQPNEDEICLPTRYRPTD